jgi:hypothetical protein
MKRDIIQLTGPALDWAAAQADRNCKGLAWRIVDGVMMGVGEVEEGKTEPCVFLSRGTSIIKRLRLKSAGIDPYSPSSLWSQGGPLITQHRIALESTPSGWEATAASSKGWWRGATPLEAAMRALVFASMGGTVDVPDELAGGNGHG